MERPLIWAVVEFKEPVAGAVLVLFSEDSLKVVRIGETPELGEFRQEVDRAYPARQT